MACFLVPAGEAVVATVVQKVIEKNEKKTGEDKAGEANISSGGLTWSRRLGWLNKLLWGGSVLLAFEHIWHGEIVPWPPFLTAMSSPADTAAMLDEMALFGGTMAVVITVVWLLMILIAELKTRTVPEVKARPVKGGA